MKVSDVIKTPVMVKKGFGGGFSDSFDNWHIMNDSGTHVGRPCDVTIAECDSWEDAQAIARCINSHDALVDMVRRLVGAIEKNIGGHRFPADVVLARRSYGGLLDEADELLKGEQ